MKLLPFQINASTQITERFIKYMEDPLLITRNKIVPFYQNLYSITGSGKTLILADAVEQIRTQLPTEPIVLWLSKGKVVVLQTYINLSTGKYAELLGGYDVKPLLECTYDDISEPEQGLLLVATTGKFNQKDMENGDRKIFQIALDNADKSLWEMLKLRKYENGIRRQLIIVYDEGHNLSDQQTEILLKLEPDALIASSATMKIPEALSKIIDRLKRDKEWKDSDFVTTVKSSDVVKSGLVKQHIMLGGYITPMEIALDEMLDDMETVSKSANELGLSFLPKAIYVSNTNIVSGVDYKKSILVPFNERMARPIVIWRHLVSKGIDPSDIAIYCDIKFDSKFPPPPNFNLFNGGDSDYANFISGTYKHIIFNLTLQEGWDDPECYFAYIDKDMGSKDQITQIIGRVLRQPGAEHYSINDLNTAHFYIRTDEKNIFKEILDDVQAKIISDIPEILISFHKGGMDSNQKNTMPTKKDKKLPEVSIDSTYAIDPIKEIINQIADYRKDTVNTVGKGGRIKILQTIGCGENSKNEWVDVDHSNRVTARWIFRRELLKYYKKVENLCDVEQPKFDALIEYNSNAAVNMREGAIKVIEAYVEHSSIVQFPSSYKTVGSIPVNQLDMVYYKNAIHEGYSGLNKFEKCFAEALDKTKYTWFRNLSRGLFEIPLLDKGGTNNFNPDFVIWKKDVIVAIDTKGDHLISADAVRKLLFIKKEGSGPDLVIRLVTEGKWTNEIRKLGKDGFTVWLLKDGKIHPIYCLDLDNAVQVCLRI